jgi:hypothetical protein
MQKPLHLREGVTQIGREPVDDSAPPALGVLTPQDVHSDVVIQPNLLLIGGKQCPLPRSTDTLLEIGEPVGVVVRQCCYASGHSASPIVVS